jgi:predicted nucleotide-binding protein
MNTITMRMLRDFIGSARGQSQSEILKSFLRWVVFKSGLSESGSIMIWDRSDGKLHLFNEDNFLFTEGYLDSSKEWKTVFENWEGLAGHAFGSERLQYSDDVSKDPRFAFFSGHDPIRSMVCVPILVRSLERRFGVASFHNASDTILDEEKRDIIEVAVGSLGLALDASAASLTNRSVFIVHGRDLGSLAILQKILSDRGIDALTLGEQARTGETISQKLDKVVQSCCAGFILVTPDDRGRFKDEKKMQNRARQNVVLEAGLLLGRFGAQRICFVRTSPNIEMPSDVRDILPVDLDVKDLTPNATGIEKTLKEWGFKWKTEASS